MPPIPVSAGLDACPCAWASLGVGRSRAISRSTRMLKPIADAAQDCYRVAALLAREHAAAGGSTRSAATRPRPSSPRCATCRSMISSPIAASYAPTVGWCTTYLVEVKKPEESHYPWDYYKILKIIPGEEAFRPMSEGGCPLLAKP